MAPSIIFSRPDVSFYQQSSSVLGSVVKTTSQTTIGLSEGANLAAGEYYSQEATDAIKAAAENNTALTSALYQVEDANGRALVVTEEQLAAINSQEAQVVFKTAEGAEIEAQLNVAQVMNRETGGFVFNADQIVDRQVATTEEG